MSSPANPYQPPSASVSDVPEPGPGAQFTPTGAVVDAGRGAAWISEGWALYKAAPLMWIVALLVLSGVQFALGLVPLLGSIASVLIGPIFMAGVLAFAHGIAQGQEADVGRLFVGFRDKLGSLVAVAAIYFALIMAIVVAFVVVAFVLLGGAQLFSAANPEDAMATMMSGASGMLVLALLLAMFGLMILVAAAYWFAPGLVLYTNLGPGEAMKESFHACMRNWLPFLVYGVLGLLVLLGGAAALVIGLFLISLPVLMASYYASFRDIFGRMP